MTQQANTDKSKDRSRRDPAATREKILAAAEKLFSRKGYAGVSMSEIAAKGKVTQSLIHHYFGSKEGLFLEVMRRHLVRVGKYGIKHLEASLAGGDFVEKGLAEYFHMLGEDPLLVRMGAWFTMFFLENPNSVREIESGDPEEDAHQKYVFDMCKRMVEAMSGMQKKGALRDDIDPAALLMVMFSAIEHWHAAKNRLLRRLPAEMVAHLDDETYLDTMTKVFIMGSKPR